MNRLKKLARQTEIISNVFTLPLRFTAEFFHYYACAVWMVFNHKRVIAEFEARFDGKAKVTSEGIQVSDGSLNWDQISKVTRDYFIGPFYIIRTLDGRTFWTSYVTSEHWQQHGFTMIEDENAPPTK